MLATPLVTWTPELFFEDAKSSKEADVYAFGIVICEVITGAQHRIFEFLRPVIGSPRSDRLNGPVAIGPGQGTWEFAERRCHGNFERCPTAADALEHFKHGAKTSAIVGPGLMTPFYGTTDEFNTNSGDYCEFHGPDSISLQCQYVKPSPRPPARP